jgi:hypothetical protein
MEFRITSAAGEEERDKLEKAFVEKPALRRMESAKELERTPFEAASITASREAIRELTARLGLPKTDVPDDHIHVLTPQEFAKEISPHAEGKSLFGHAYIPRNDDPVVFTRLLTHELSHAASHAQIQLNQGAADPRQVSMRHRKIGFTFSPNRKEKPRIPFFNGLNEGTTELCARFLRNQVATTDLPFEDAGRKSLKRFVFYRPWVIVVDALLQIIAQAEGVSYEDAQDDLLRDYFRGTYTILQRLERHRNGVTHVLREADHSPDGAEAAANKLQLTEALRDMRRPTDRSSSS